MNCISMAVAKTLPDFDGFDLSLFEEVKREDLFSRRYTSTMLRKVTQLFCERKDGCIATFETTQNRSTFTLLENECFGCGSVIVADEIPQVTHYRSVSIVHMYHVVAASPMPVLGWPAP